MTVYVLDSSALLRFIDDEPGAQRVEDILKECVRGQASVCLSAMQWGEVTGNLRRRFGAKNQSRLASAVLPSEVEIMPVTAQRAVEAADIKVDRKIAYADAIAVQLAAEAPGRVLVTADYGFKPVDDITTIEFLTAK